MAYLQILSESLLFLAGYPIGTVGNMFEESGSVAVAAQITSDLNGRGAKRSARLGGATDIATP